MAKPPMLLLDVWKGNSFKRKFRAVQVDPTTKAVIGYVDLRGATMVLTTAWNAGKDYAAGSFRKEFALALDDTEAQDGYYEITLDYNETRKFPNGQVTKYEIERWMGEEQKTVLYGTFRVDGWVNDDTTPTG